MECLMLGDMYRQRIAIRCRQDQDLDEDVLKLASRSSVSGHIVVPQQLGKQWLEIQFLLGLKMPGTFPVRPCAKVQHAWRFICATQCRAALRSNEAPHLKQDCVGAMSHCADNSTIRDHILQLA